LQFDSGMTRAGLPAEEVAALAADRAIQGRLELVLILSHLACADEPGHAMNAAQLERFNGLRAAWPSVPWSLANSAGIFLGRQYHGQLVRPGIALYGGHPCVAGPNPMQEVVRVQARVLQMRRLSVDASVGYGASYRAEAPCRIATIAIGYADGYPRSLGNRAEVSSHGRRAPVIGRVSMDLVTIDISGPEHDDLAVGDYVDVIGGAISIEAVANWAGTINYELLTNLSARAQRIYSARI
jgi:alanine racemase